MPDPHDLKALLAARRLEVEAALERYLPPADAPPARLHGAMRHSVFSGGKRIRPILALLGCEVAGGAPGAAMAPGCAAELIHTYSLVHDDLPAMDDDDVRRGRPTCHRAFDEATAILAGDALLTLAFEMVAGDGSIPADRRVSVMSEFTHANGSHGMVGGQAADMGGEGCAATVASVTFIHERKTAMPLQAAVVVGGLVAGAGPDAVDALRAYGRAIGLSFQIADDLLDVTGTAEEMGKAVGKDVGAGKLTYPAAVGVDAARERALELTEEALQALEPLGDGAWPLAAIARYIVERRS